MNVQHAITSAALVRDRQAAFTAAAERHRLARRERGSARTSRRHLPLPVAHRGRRGVAVA